MDVLKTENK